MKYSHKMYDDSHLRTHLQIFPWETKRFELKALENLLKRVRKLIVS